MSRTRAAVRLVGALEQTLDAKSRTYKTPSLAALFLMNNYHFILKVAPAAGLSPCRVVGHGGKQNPAPQLGFIFHAALRAARREKGAGGSGWQCVGNGEEGEGLQGGAGSQKSPTPSSRRRLDNAGACGRATAAMITAVYRLDPTGATGRERDLFCLGGRLGAGGPGEARAERSARTGVRHALRGRHQRTQARLPDQDVCPPPVSPSSRSLVSPSSLRTWPAATHSHRGAATKRSRACRNLRAL